jgi:hypothetical protein
LLQSWNKALDLLYLTSYSCCFKIFSLCSLLTYYSKKRPWIGLGYRLRSRRGEAPHSRGRVLFSLLYTCRGCNAHIACHHKAIVREATYTITLHLTFVVRSREENLGTWKFLLFKCARISSFRSSSVAVENRVDHSGCD